MSDAAFGEKVSGIAALEHPLTQQAYQFVVGRDWTTRDEAASALDVARSVAAFHLDKLVDAGMLDARYERVSGRTGPGAGRPSKLYRRSAREIDLSFPPRRYDLASSLLADAVTRATRDDVPVEHAVSAVAREKGERVGGDAAARRRSAPRAALMDVLVDHGYEPQKRGRDIALLNCPFHNLAEEHRSLICGMNVEFLVGVLGGLGAEKLCARLAPDPGYCCVRIGPA